MNSILIMKKRRHTIIWMYMLVSTSALFIYGSRVIVVAPPKNLPWEIGPTARRSDTDATLLGIQSTKPDTYFQGIRETIDQADDHVRCQRYGFRYTPDRPRNRRIFYGALIADEPWELFEIVAAETRGIFSGVVLVESNRTQNFSERPFQRLDHAETFQNLFGMSKDRVQVRAYMNEDPNLRGLAREHAQRAEILKGWNELGMKGPDVGYLGDSDETFTRDFLRAVQVCDGIDQLEYHKHHCAHEGVKMISNTGVFQGSPECVSEGQSCFHPDMIIGACIEGIGNETVHSKAPRPALRQGRFCAPRALEANAPIGRVNAR